MSAGTRRVVVRGFVVKVQSKEPSPRGGSVTVRREVSRLYHSRDAAEVCMNLFQKTNPERDYYIHEKGGHDDAEIF